MEKYYIWLLLAFGESEPVISELTARFGTAEKIYEAFRQNISLTGAEYIEKAAKTELKAAEKLQKSITDSGYGIVTWESPDYPEILRKTNEPPCVLFTCGDISLLHKKLLTVVGARNISAHTEVTVPKVIASLDKEYAVVGTLSEGCDQLTCLNCLKYGVSFIEVMPCGFGHTYPAGSKSLRRFLLANGGLLITEYLPKAKSGQGTFMRRSRILGGISPVSLVLQAGENSGALLTAEHSAHPLFLPPYDVFRKEYVGAVNAVRNGAKLYLSEKSIELAFSEAAKETETEKHKYRKTKKTEASPRKQEKQEAPPAKKKEEAHENIEFDSEEQHLIYGIISGSGEPVGLEELTAASGFTPDVLSETLLDLEINGLIKALGNRYTLS